MQSNKGALKDIKVIDASRVLAGPFAAQILGDHGADVIKIESPDGDECRGFGPPFVQSYSAYFNAVNRNKDSVILDLNESEDREIFFEMIETADVLIENFKLSTLERWGIEDIQWFTQLNPRLIHCRITGFGDDGPYGGLPGYDAMVQAMAGLISINGDDEGNSFRLGVPVVDLTTGMNTAMAALLALQARHNTQRGQLADISLYDSAVAMAHPFLTNYLHSNKVPRPIGNQHSNIVPYNTYKTQTVPLFVAIGNDRLFSRLCNRLGIAHISNEQRFATNSARVKNRVELEPILCEAFLQFDGNNLSEELLKDGIPAAPILDIKDVAHSQHASHREMVVNKSFYTGPGIPIKLTETPGSIRKPAPELGNRSCRYYKE